jgi:hypothetical protein
METTPPNNQPEPHIEKVEEIVAECRKNADLYYSLFGVEVSLGRVAWHIRYWYDHENGNEWLRLTRDINRQDYPALYEVNDEGEMVKNESMTKKDGSNIFWDAAGEQVMTDIDELEILKAIVMAAHKNRRK